MTKVTIELINPDHIKTHETFEDLFPLRPELLATIEGMRNWEYDVSQPIIVATWEGQDQPVCIDGHTRLQAAKNAGIMEVPIYEYSYTSEEAAIEHAIELQCHRRNLSDAELFHFIEMLDKRSVPQRNENGKFSGAPNGAAGKSSEATAELLAISSRKVERMRTILDHGDSETVKAVKNGEMSVNKGYEETQKKRKKQKSTKEKSALQLNNQEDAISDSLAGVPTDEANETTVVSEATCADHMDDMTVVLVPEQYRALRELGGSIEYHVAQAIDMYLQSLSNPDAGEDTCADVYDDDDEYDDGCED